MEAAKELSLVYRGKSLLMKQASVLRERWERAGELERAGEPNNQQSLQGGPGSWMYDQGFSPLCSGDLKFFETTGCSNSQLEMLHLDSFYKKNQETGMIRQNCYRQLQKDH